MTTVSAATDLAHLLDLLADDLGTVLRASLDHDRTAARHVLHTGSTRRAAARGLLPDPSTVRRTLAVELLVADVVRISRLVDELARRALVGDGPVEPDQEEAVLLLARHGAERLHQLAAGAPGPDLGREYLRCGRCLLHVLDQLDEDRSTAGCCAALTATILQASRHAARVA